MNTILWSGTQAHFPSLDLLVSKAQEETRRQVGPGRDSLSGSNSEPDLLALPGDRSHLLLRPGPARAPARSKPLPV